MRLPAEEPGRFASGALAVMVHLLFFGFLFFGLSWQKKIVNPMVVDLWQELPEPARKSVPLSAPAPKAAPKPQPVIPPPQTRKEPPPPPPPLAPKLETARPSAAEIELKEKLRKQKEQEELARLEEQKRAELEKRRLEEEQRKLAEEKRRAEAEQKRAEAEQKKAEAERRRMEAEEKARAEAEQKRAEQERLRKEEGERRAEEVRRAEEQRRAEEARREEERKQRAAAAERERQLQEAARKQREAEEARRTAQAAARAAQQKLIDDWRARIQAKIKGRVVVPPNVEGNPEARFEVVLLPGGDVLSATLRKASGNPAYDAAVERAILAAQPLPVPSDTDLFQENFRELTLVFRPKDTDR